MSILTESDRAFFRKNGYITKTDLLTTEDRDRFLELFDRDRREHRYRWHLYGHHQRTNYDILVTMPEIDEAIRHPGILGAVDELMGGPTCFGEIGARYMDEYAGDYHQGWHRDRPHWPDHPLRMDYIQSMIYLTDVDESTHCFSLSPESVDEEILEDKDAQLNQGGCVDIHGPAGTVCLFNVAVLHTATTRPTKVERKTLQTYYGHRDRAPLANDSLIPSMLWRDDPDPATRAFYGNLNDVTRLYIRAFGAGVEEEL